MCSSDLYSLTDLAKHGILAEEILKIMKGIIMEKLHKHLPFINTFPAKAALDLVAGQANVTPVFCHRLGSPPRAPRVRSHRRSSGSLMMQTKCGNFFDLVFRVLNC